MSGGIKGVGCNTFSLSQRENWWHSVRLARNFSVSFGRPPNGCILCQLNSLFRRAGNCLAGNGRRETLLSRRTATPENRFNWCCSNTRKLAGYRDTPFTVNLRLDNDHRISLFNDGLKRISRRIEIFLRDNGGFVYNNVTDGIT